MENPTFDIKLIVLEKIENICFEGKRVLIRVDFNVPLNNDLEIMDDSRIRAAIPTIKTVLSKGGSVILISHRGRPDGKNNNKLSLSHLKHHLGELLGLNVSFVSDCIGEHVEFAVKSLPKGGVLLLENLRFYNEEMAGDVAFAKKLSLLGDVYINDAFGAAHRAHSSTSVIASFFFKNKFFGHLMIKEINSLEKVLCNSKKPLTAVIGGAKVSSKISGPLISLGSFPSPHPFPSF